MTKRRMLALAILPPFALLSAYAVYDVGYLGILDYHRHSSAGWQVFADLVVALVLLLSWLIRDARQRGRMVWPWVVTTLLLGSFGPLFYLAIADERKPGRE